MTTFAPHPLSLLGVTNTSKVQLLRKPMYRPSGEGYACRIDKTAQDGTTLLFPRPSFPYFHRIYCLYAAFRKLSIEKLKSSALMSQRALIHTSKISLSRQILLKTWKRVMQLTLLQQRFSWSLGIGLQTPHLHHSGELLLPGLGGGGGGAFFSSSSFFAKSKLPLPIARTFLRRYSISCLVRVDTNSSICVAEDCTSLNNCTCPSGSTGVFTCSASAASLALFLHFALLQRQFEVQFWLVALHEHEPRPDLRAHAPLHEQRTSGAGKS